MNSAFNRPLPASLNTTPAVQPQFPINIGQPVRLVFQQPYNGASVGFNFATMAAAQTQSSWIAMMAASDGTAMFHTPIFSNSKIAAAKELATSADTNQTYRGIPEFFGMGGSGLIGEFHGKDAPSLNSMTYISAFSQQDSSGQSNCSCYIVNHDGDVWGIGDQDGTDITNIQPINFFNFWYGTASTEGYATATVVPFGLWLPPYWSDKLVCIPRTSTFDLRLIK